MPLTSQRPWSSRILAILCRWSRRDRRPSGTRRHRITGRHHPARALFLQSLPLPRSRRLHRPRVQPVCRSNGSRSPIRCSARSSRSLISRSRCCCCSPPTACAPRLVGGISSALALDIVAASLVLIALTGHSLVPMMLLVNVGIAALLLPRRAYLFATLAAVGVARAVFLRTPVGAGERRPDRRDGHDRGRLFHRRRAAALPRRPHARDRGSRRAARRRSAQPRTGQRPDHPAHEDRRAAGRPGQPHPAHQRIGLASDRQPVAEPARTRHGRAGTVAPAVPLAPFQQDRPDRGRAGRPTCPR